MKTQKIITAFALAALVGAAGPALASTDSVRFPGKSVEQKTVDMQTHDTAMQAEQVGAYNTQRFPGLKVEHLTRELEDMRLDTDAEPVTTDAPIHG